MVLLVGCSTRPYYDSETLHWAYCDHMGYERIINESTDEIGNYQWELLCIFDDNSSCDTYDFYRGDCGEDKVRPILDRKVGESVYPEFEDCEEGLVMSEREYVMDQEICLEDHWYNQLRYKIKSFVT